MPPCRLPAVLLCAMVLSACATPGPDRTETDQATAGTTTPQWDERPTGPLRLAPAGPLGSVTGFRAQDAMDPEAVAEHGDLWERIRAGFAMEGMEHERVRAEIRFYARHNRFLESLAERASPYLHYIVEQVEERDMPLELALLPAVESGFRPEAYSRSRAAGLWQFMPATARAHGLRESWWYDGRRDVVASTRAALDYLEYLHDMFDGDWQLALAAYNAGEGTVQRAVRRNHRQGKPTDYWNLPLPRETRHFVPRLLAVSALVKDPDAHGMPLISIPDEPYMTVVNVGGQIDLTVAAELAGIDPEHLQVLNPGHSRWATDPEGPHRLVVPADSADQFRLALAELPEDERVRWQRHTVVRGESLGVIARRYGTTVAALQDANNLDGHLIREGRELLVPAGDSDAPASAAAGDSQPIRHTVQHGDTIWELARRYGVRRSELAAWNGMDTEDTLHPGQTLVVRTDGATAAGSSEQEIRYTVRQGDSLYRIANRFGVSVDDLRRWNGLGDGGHLQPGQQLTMRVDATVASNL